MFARGSLSGDVEGQRREAGVDRETALAVERECRGLVRFGFAETAAAHRRRWRPVGWLRPAGGRCLGDAPRRRRTGRAAARTDPAQEMPKPGEWLRIRPSVERGRRRRTRARRFWAARRPTPASRPEPAIASDIAEHLAQSSLFTMCIPSMYSPSYEYWSCPARRACSRVYGSSLGVVQFQHNVEFEVSHLGGLAGCTFGAQ